MKEQKKLSGVDMLLKALEIGTNLVLTDYFATEEEAKEFLFKQLQKKYGKQFQFAEPSYASLDKEKYGGGFSYGGQVVAIDNPDRSSIAIVSTPSVPDLVLIDDYHIYLFKDKLYEKIKKITETIDKSGILDYEIKFRGEIISRRWTGRESLEKYRTSGDFETWINIRLPYGKPDTEYMEVIRQWTDALLAAKDYNYTVQVHTDNPEHRELLYWMDLNQYEGFSTERMTEAYLAQKFESNRGESLRNKTDGVTFADD